MQFVVRERVRGLKLPAARARGALLAELARELRHMRDTHDQYKFGMSFYNTLLPIRQGGTQEATYGEPPYLAVVLNVFSCVSLTYCK